VKVSRDFEKTVKTWKMSRNLEKLLKMIKKMSRDLTKLLKFVKKRHVTLKKTVKM